MASVLVGAYVLAFLSMAKTAWAAGAPTTPINGGIDVATGACDVGISPGANPCRGAHNAAVSVDSKLLSPAMQVALLSALTNLATFVFDRIAYESAIWVATGGQGESPLFNAKDASSAWKDFGMDIAGDAIGELGEAIKTGLNTNFDICAPAGPNGALFSLSLQLGLKQAYQPTEPKCDFQSIRSNWDSFISTTAAQALNPSQTVLKAFAQGFAPGQNELSASIGLNLSVHQQVIEAKTNKLAEQVNSGGFKAVTDVITGQVKTPSSLLQNSFQHEIDKSRESGTDLNMKAAIANADLLGSMFLNVAGVFTNTLLSTLMNKIYTGYFAVQPDSDPLNGELANVVSREDAAKQFASIITAAPTQITNYSVLSEFVSCPGSGGITVRNINNCVLDAGFASAVARAESGVPMTVQEAIDEGLLHGDWPIIPNTGVDVAKNQDVLCYTYGYCYGNIVKMRKARILPIGWEIAASRNSDSNTATLQEIIDGYDNCGTQGGGIDSTHQWCHLVDPNWVLKYPETQCRAYVNGELQISTLSPGRAGTCADTPSCISENNDGSCNGGYGYCVEEKNTWKFRGNDCPAEYATCLAFKNADTGATADYLLNTVDYANCNADNAGCLWYRTNKYSDDAGTVDDTSDDAFNWLAGTETFDTAAHTDVRTASSSPSSYSYDTTGGTTESYSNYAYQDRIYYNNNVSSCDSSAAGCSEVYKIGDSLVLNLVQNASFEIPDSDCGTALPEDWTGVASADFDCSSGSAYYGSGFVSTSATSASITQENIRLSPNSFYTLSFYAKSASGTSEALANLSLVDESGAAADTRGTSFSGDCTQERAGRYEVSVVDVADAWTQYSCTFTTLDDPLYATVDLSYVTNSVSFDSVQLELGENASDFSEGYNTTSPSPSYLLLPPAYLNCSGASTDPSECDSYAQVCSAQDVGCNLYAPDNGDPSVPAIAQSLDECPSECVGYASYKQEATDRQAESFPLYLIADKATSCTSDAVGCDSFTNLDATDAGGEGTEYYTDMRACLKTSMTGDAPNDQDATYFTWEGSDASGYQLVTWTLLKSNMRSRDLTYAGSGNVDANVALGPCVSWNVTSESTVVCVDETAGAYADIAADTECDEHDDIFANPNCREFYDDSSEGNIHYREYPSTISVSDDCHPYRYTAGTQDDCDLGGGYWTDVGDCRYFGLPEESTECSEASAGCRSYTGGGGRNASTVYSDDFEDGSLSEYHVDAAGPTVSVSNESVATGGHSMRVEIASTGNQSVTTAMTYLSWPDPTLAYDSTDSATTCSDLGTDHEVTSSGCLIDYGDGNPCTVAEGDVSCGTLTGLLVQGKTYQLNFWAKGSGSIHVTMVDKGGVGTTHDFVDPTDGENDNDALSLDSGWHEYTLGPLDTSEFATFGDASILTFSSSASSIFYLDNVRLKALEDNVTLIQDSWVVPSTCDTTPDGAPSPQYYLGCQAYTDQNGDAADLYQFSDLCSEEVVGCEAIYDTHSSDSAYGMTYNARCVNTAGTVESNTDCVLEGETACTIASGDTFCLFDRAGSLPSTFPSADGFELQLGPEAAVVEGDSPAYVVDNGSATCTAENVGCQEIGLPTYSQDKSEATGFTSTYVINDPDSYSDTLCEDRSLFCAEWSSTQDGNFYFKNPSDQTCEYQSGVTIDSTTYSGWFKTGTSEPCYWTDTNLDGVFGPTDDSSYLINGSQYGVWRNGDDDYSGWVASCPSSADLCTEFDDESDTGSGTYPAGTPYYFLDDSSLSEDSLNASDQCQGQVSQKAGCGLFYDSDVSALTSNTTASYIASVHSDILYGEAPGAKVDPISCKDGGEGIVATDGTSFNPCKKRCEYVLSDATDSIVTPSSELISGTTYDDRSCFEDADCPDIGTVNGDTAAGTCVDTPDNSLSNDANRVMKVYRDRQCAAWLSCRSSKVSWDQRTSKYTTVCDSVGLCTKYTGTGDNSSCTQWAENDPVLLNDAEYAGRDVTWNGLDFSGYAIPNQLPIDHYSQVNIAPDTQEAICVSTLDHATPEIEGDGFVVYDAETHDCSADDAPYNESRTFAQDFRLAYNAGPCSMTDSGWGGTCTAGTCASTGYACGSSDDCDTSTAEICVIGQCQYADSTIATCLSDAECVNSNYPTCDITLSKCVSNLAEDTTATDCHDAATNCLAPPDTNGTAQCTPNAVSKTGACFNNQCLTDLQGDPLTAGTAASVECRGYPETMSPWSEKILDSSSGTSWISSTGTPESQPTAGDDRPYAFMYGFQSNDVCAPLQDTNDSDSDGNTSELLANDECLCSYTKGTYGDGGTYRYYPPNYDSNFMLTGVCVGGTNPGKECEASDSGLSTGCGTYGTCSTLSRQDNILGWDGYCLEKDSSIQLYGSADENDRACLTWLPVDQLAGSTDLYGKYLEAGFAATDTYYCGEMQDSYTFSVGNTTTMEEGVETGVGPACASTVRSICYDTDGKGRNDGSSPWASFTDHQGASEGCLGSVWCPDGYYGVMTGCGELSYTAGADFDKNECHVGLYEDCPFFCVPKGSYKTSNFDPIDTSLDGPIGTACVPPDDQSLPNGFVITTGLFDGGVATAKEMVDAGFSSRAMPNTIGNGYGTQNSYLAHAPGTDVYLVRDQFEGVTFHDLMEFYDDCQTKGIVGSADILPLIQPFTSLTDLLSTEPDQTDSDANFAYRNLHVSAQATTACTALVQVSSETAEPATGNYNYAWTDRDWSSGTSGFAIRDDSRFAYGIATPQAIYGMATNLDDWNADFVSTDTEVRSTDQFPERAVMCAMGDNGSIQVISEAGVCPSGWSLTNELYDIDAGFDAMPFYDVQLSADMSFVASVGTDYESNCLVNDGDPATYVDGDCDCTIATEVADCNDGIYCDSSSLLCVGGTVDGTECASDDDCQKIRCVSMSSSSVETSGSLGIQTTESGFASSGYICAYPGTADDTTVIPFNEVETSLNGIDRLSQIFAKAYSAWSFDDEISGLTEGVVESIDQIISTPDQVTGSGWEPLYWGTGGAYAETIDSPWNYAGTMAVGDPTDLSDAVTPTPPIVLSVGDCNGTHCEEGDEGKFSVNEQSSGTISGGDGSKSVSVSFFTYADKNQMPIRSIRMDWGDAERSGDNAWPISQESQSGSSAHTNYYKNQRGYDSHDAPICGSTDEGWGTATNACANGYATFNHSYVCNSNLLNGSVPLPDCQYADGSGATSTRLLNSPCKGGGSYGIGSANTCIYQPRVFVEDNWGWCTGFCDAGTDGTTECYGSECNSQACPDVDINNHSTGSACPDLDTTTSNPWVNFDGYVEVSS